jgi:hypothetical protein
MRHERQTAKLPTAKQGANGNTLPQVPSRAVSRHAALQQVF